jgi:protease I
MDPSLSGMHVAIVVSDGFEAVEFSEFKAVLEREGAITKIVSDEKGKVQAADPNADIGQVEADLTFGEADPEDFDAIVIPGGAASADRIGNIPEAQRFVQGMNGQDKPIAAIGHGVSVLISAGSVQDRNLASAPALQGMIQSAGGHWVDQGTVADGNLITGRGAENLHEFGETMVEVIGARMRANLRGKADGHAVGIASS